MIAPTGVTGVPTVVVQDVGVDVELSWIADHERRVPMLYALSRVGHSHCHNHAFPKADSRSLLIIWMQHIVGSLGTAVCPSTRGWVPR